MFLNKLYSRFIVTCHAMEESNSLIKADVQIVNFNAKEMMTI